MTRNQIIFKAIKDVQDTERKRRVVYLIHVWTEDGDYSPVCLSVRHNKKDAEKCRDAWTSSKHISIIEGPYKRKKNAR